MRLFLSAELPSYAPFTVSYGLLCVRQDMADLARSIGIVIHPFDSVRWFRAPHTPSAILRSKVKWPPAHGSWIGEHPEAKRDGRPLYHLGILPKLPFVPKSRKHRYRYRDESGEINEWQFDPKFLDDHPVSEVIGNLAITAKAPQPFLDLIEDEEHFVRLPFLRPRTVPTKQATPRASKKTKKKQ